MAIPSHFTHGKQRPRAGIAHGCKVSNRPLTRAKLLPTARRWPGPLWPGFMEVPAHPRGQVPPSLPSNSGTGCPSQSTAWAFNRRADLGNFAQKGNSLQILPLGRCLISSDIAEMVLVAELNSRDWTAHIFPPPTILRPHAGTALTTVHSAAANSGGASLAVIPKEDALQPREELPFPSCCHVSHSDRFCFQRTSLPSPKIHPVWPSHPGGGVTHSTSAVARLTAEMETEGSLGTRQPHVTPGGRTDCLVHAEYWFSSV